MKNKYFAFEYEEHEVEFFETFNEAKGWLMDRDFCDGFPEGFTEGKSYIGKITHQSDAEESDNKGNYCACNLSSCHHEHWPYKDEWDEVYIPKIKKLNPPKEGIEE